ncbi:MAG: protein phosphatase 2C domain-containing protein [Planctomycetota bacterium]|nr:protein phosphatase 2C domain-containing protein [Planctomycetota bacterium]
MPSTPIVQYASRTDVGMRRSSNQDSLAVRLCSEYEEWHRCGHLFVVADGMGGHAVGDLASRIAVETLPHAYFKCDAPLVQNRMKQAIHTANKAINDRGRENREFEGMGTTCSALTLAEGGAYIGHVGDSRVYRVRRGRIEQLTFDHSLQWEMIRLGRATVDNVELFHPRNVITRCLGPDIHVQVDIEGPFSVEAGDYFVLCSDGLTNHVTDSEIGQIVASLPPAESSRLLINLANCRGGTDNSTVVIAGIDSFPATVSERPNKLTPLQCPETTQDMPGRSSSGRQILLAATAVSCLVAGMTLGVMNNYVPAAFLIAAAVLAWLLSRRMASRPRSEAVDDSASAVVPIVATSDESSSRPHVPTPAFNPKSPYRTLNAAISDAFLTYLAEVQSDLVQAARDGAWEINFEEVTALNKQAVSNQQAGKLTQTIRSRAKAIDLLTREMYLRSRTN